MEILFEFIGDMLFELLLMGGEHAVKSSKTPKPLRIILATLALLFFIAVIGLIIWAGIAAIMNGSVAGGIFTAFRGLLHLSLNGLCRVCRDQPPAAAEHIVQIHRDTEDQRQNTEDELLSSDNECGFFHRNSPLRS